jgi:hypothetical protein
MAAIGASVANEPRCCVGIFLHAPLLENYSDRAGEKTPEFSGGCTLKRKSRWNLVANYSLEARIASLGRNRFEIPPRKNLVVRVFGFRETAVFPGFRSDYLLSALSVIF